MESLDHRERRLLVLGEAIERHLDEGWFFFLVIGHPDHPETTNLLCNAPLGTTAVLAMLQTLAERYAQTGTRREL